MRTLYVKLISLDDLSQHWGSLAYTTGSSIRFMSLDSFVYIQCTKKGEVNYDKASVYSVPELIQRDGVVVVK
jgi:hypothetical protein